MGRQVSMQFGKPGSVNKKQKFMTLLWVNLDPSSSFAAQTVSLNLSDYDAVFIPMISASGNRIYDLFADVGGATAYAHFVALATNLVARQRSASATTTGIAFSNCQSRTQGSSANTNTNTHLVPAQIYGIKFG